jgi:hypothetical protein
LGLHGRNLAKTGRGHSAENKHRAWFHLIQILANPDPRSSASQWLELSGIQTDNDLFGEAINSAYWPCFFCGSRAIPIVVNNNHVHSAKNRSPATASSVVPHRINIPGALFHAA